MQDIVLKTTALFIEKSFAIPRIVLARKGEMAATYFNFEPDLKGLRLRPVATNALMARLDDQKRYHPEARLEDYVVRGLVGFDDMSYDDNRELLYKLAGAVVRHLRSYLLNEDDTRNVLQYYETQIVRIVYSQMQQHKAQEAAEFEATVSKGFMILRPKIYFESIEGRVRDCRLAVDEGLLRKGVLFGGFERCLSASQRFESDAERRFALILEDQSDPTIVKWVKPHENVFQIHYKGDKFYKPNFVVETRTAKLICEVKKATDVDALDQIDKANAAAEWCKYATKHEKLNGGKSWSYLLIPECAVKDRLAWALWKTKFRIALPRKFEELFGSRA